MTGRHQVIDFVAPLLSVNDESYLGELTIASDAGMQLTGDTLRKAVQHRAAARRRVVSLGRGHSNGGDTYNTSDSGHGPLAAKGYE
jgi:hypothetical protein